ncbi:MAG TPA: ATP-binding protein [Candidatus Limnocylindrales bacterium]|nr:ATP-binding protein [Candidatus Limnocylindrales bacterium]
MSRNIDDSKNETGFNKIKWLIFLRIVVITLTLGSALLFQLQNANPAALDPLYNFIIFAYLFAVFSIILLKIIRNFYILAYFQIISDLLFETGFVYVTGGIKSFFSFTYIFSIIAASIILFRKGAFVMASLSSLLYGTLATLQYYEIIPIYGPPGFPFTTLNISSFYYNIFLNVCAFYLVAFLSSYLAESLKITHEQLQETSSDLNELQVFHKNILQSMSSGLLTTNLVGKITSYNRAAEEITGYKFEEAYGADLDQILPGVCVKEIFDMMEKTNQSSYRFQKMVKSKDGTTMYLGMTASILKNIRRNEVTGLTIIFQDLTELREMEEQVRRSDRLAALGELAAGIAHEIRNPLASIKGSVQMLKADLKLEEESRTLMDIIIRESTRLNNIITDFLVYARPTPLTLNKFDIIREIIDPTLVLLKNSPECSDLIHIEKIYPQEPLWVVCDRQQMRQVLWNLCLNAVQAMPRGGILLISVKKIEGNLDGKDISPSKKLAPPEIKNSRRSWCTITIQDTGYGIKSEDLEKIFVPFFTTKENGTGLGLAIVHNIIENHQGIIKVKSKINEGTIFEVSLPCSE